MPFFRDNIGVPVPLKSWYRAWLYRCTECGATVNESDRRLHESWHDQLRAPRG